MKAVVTMYQVLQAHITISLQVCLIILLLLTSVSIKMTSTTIFLIICFLLTLLLPKLQKLRTLLCQDQTMFDLNYNPFKGHTGPGYLTAEKDAEIAKTIANFVLYDASKVACLKRFKVVKTNSECIFAKRSKLWGSQDYIPECSLEENIRRMIPNFYKFTMAFQDLSLDAFLVELPGQLYGTSIKVFGNAVRRVLLTLRQADLQRQRQILLKTQSNKDLLKVQIDYLSGEDPKKWNGKSWVFEFNKITFFITSFAPFYPETNSRFSFGCENCYLLFQPEIAFAIRDLPDDTAETHWNHPVTVRDKIRVAFRDAGREYEVPMKLNEPMVYEIVKKVDPHDDQLYWWLLE
ncbi:uncharacterized protein LOC106068361 [Biomphalaria glabrata]|uniref:Uncharacterized protein LOC106068361 n=1 Tax=Biomphalaria glabrata TaxID=6526 RepID=A0A9W2YNA1_BIOGL|nr:uncharacterized protein LOC106068361 [Biomphalaria glabrata]XP_055864301.1 uncharacterized protein LOC106068361 [Biomphalaria glabrata]XP_055864302.1 uncharacterized protein LOC106068361 [Biomphalaria glabrata]XP_055864303.1 uncharacterized protein LOC106068361 [Biomphalaria glabrata]XP_055864304.1 uncharacterized protein LOC106068361 [Biomphalaria glabrata]XP_055864306.1 uncharacterized protein LOC106068361 [Biomphalaria glabrata]XP_055864307.1 uncharacterized protein LOC106068361 [Biomph